MIQENKNMNLIMRFVFVGCTLTLLLFIIGCNKTKNFEELDVLVKKKWHLISVTSDGLAINSECDLDDVLMFEDNNNFDYNYGALQCDENNLEKTAKTWKMIDDYTVLRMKYKISGSAKGSVVDYWKIIELSDSLLIVEDDLAEENNQVPEIRTYRSL